MKHRINIHSVKKWASQFNSFLDNLLSFFDKYPREYFVILFFAFFSLLIVFKWLWYTVFEHDKYKAIADKQQTAQSVIEVDRWTIYSNNESGWVLATSVYLNDLAIDPTAIWNKDKLDLFLTDIVYRESCLYKSRKDCYNSLLSFFKVNEIEDFIYTEAKVKQLILKKIEPIVDKDKVTSVLIYQNLWEEQIFNIEKAALKWVYIYLNHLYVNPEEIQNDDLTASKLSTIIWTDLETIKKSIRKRNLRYSKILSKVSIWTSEFIKWEIQKEKELINKWIISPEESYSWFIILDSDSTRYYPENFLASQIIWFVDNSKTGRYWIEWYFNDILKWKEWITNFKAWTSWIIVDLSKVEEKEKAVDWADIRLTIDRNIQDEVQTIIENWVKEYWANKWSIIVMEPNTWNVLAMANYPTFDSNNYWDVYELEKVNPSDYYDIISWLRWKTVFVQDKINWVNYVYKWKYLPLREATEWELLNSKIIKYKFINWEGPWAYRNDIVEYLYEPGSVFKSIIVAMGLDSWDISRFDMYQDKWYVTIDKFKITNVSDKCTWYNSYQNALNYSCNTWMVHIIEQIWKAMVYKYLQDFWFWKLTWITLSWETYSALEPYENWSRAWLFTRSYGRWMVTTQLKLATAYSVLANGWVYYEPNILKEINFWDWRSVKYEPTPSHRVISEDASREITAMLIDWVENWVAKNWRVLGYTVAWKTWTSGYVTAWKYETWAATTIGSFAWYWPAENPKFVIVVRLDRPRTNQYGWSTSAFLFSKTAKYLMDYYKIPQTRNPVDQLNADKKKDIEINN